MIYLLLGRILARGKLGNGQYKSRFLFISICSDNNFKTKYFIFLRFYLFFILGSKHVWKTMVAMYYSPQIYDVTLTYKKNYFLRTLQKLMKDSLTNALFNFIKADTIASVSKFSYVFILQLSADFIFEWKAAILFEKLTVRALWAFYVKLFRGTFNFFKWHTFSYHFWKENKKNSYLFFRINQVSCSFPCRSWF